MVMSGNRIKDCLARGEVVLLPNLGFPAPTIVEIIGSCGYKAVSFDLEHGINTVQSIAHDVRAAEAAGLTPVVRVPGPDAHLVTQLLDMGIKGILFPNIDSPEAAANAVATCRYAPHGIRGACPNVRAVGYDSVDWDTYCSTADEDTLVMAIIESRAGVERIDEILAVPGIDVVFLGPFDLSVSLGVGGHMNHPRVRAALTEVTKKAMAKGVAVAGLAVMSQLEELQHYIDLGVRLFLLSFIKTLSLALNDVRQQIEARALTTART
jgi:4-hydroxy-2-oxoheptanedioate aldolase